MFVFEVDRAADRPLHEQIVTALREAIERGIIAAGELLPSTRGLASRLAVHRSTVSAAYRQLWSLGFVELKQGARPKVRPRLRLREPGETSAGTSLGWVGRSPDGVEQVLAAARKRRPVSRDVSGDVVSFESLAVDERLYPVDRFRSALNRVLARDGARLLGYGDPAGYRPLRESIAHRLRQHGICVGPDELLVSNGSQHGLDLLLRSIARPGARVVVEAPTYDYLLPLLALNGLEAHSVSMREDGMDLEELAALIEREAPALVYTMPSFQNPSGVTTDQGHRESLYTLCAERGVPIFEDGYDEEMQYSGRPVLAIKALDRHGVVVYAGTFSKVLFPGVRIGWIAAPAPLLERMSALRCYGEIAPHTLLHAAMDEFCRSGSFERHVTRMHRIYRRRMGAALGALEREVGERASWVTPRGGFLVWLRLPEGDRDALAACLAREGVRASAGGSFYADGSGGHALRLSISALDEEEIARGVRRLGRALRAWQEA